MAMANLQPGNVLNVAVGQILRTAHVYRTGQGYDSPGHVAWAPDGGEPKIDPLAVGQTVSYQINSAEGKIANGCPSMVQVLWDNGTPNGTRGVAEGAAMRVIKAASMKASATGGSSIQQAMQTLSAQWYNARTSSLGLSPATYQLVQGNMVVGTLSETLWSIFDSVPPPTVNSYYNPSQINSFSSNYGSIINNLNQPGASNFQNDMGDYYSKWTTFLQSQTSLPAGGLTALFQTWSQLNMPPGQAAQCQTDLSQIYQGPVYSAQAMWINAGGVGATKAYTITVEQVTTKVGQAPSGQVMMNSQTESSNVSNTWAKGEVGGFYDLFTGKAGGSYDQLSMDLMTAGLTVNAQFSHVLTMPGGPLTQPSTDPILSQYNPWYSSSALDLAYSNNNNVVWKNNPPTWSNMFGPTGAMLRTCSGLVIVDGINLTVTSNVGFTADQQQQFKAAAAVGFWPFFEASASGGWSSSSSFDDKGDLTYTASSPVGNPVILGVIVTPISGALML